METFDSALAKALISAQADLRNPPFDKANTAFGAPRGYSSLAAHVDTIRPALAKHKLAVVQLVGSGPEKTLTLLTRLVHESGQFMESTVSVPMPASEQKVGSALTYLRRYALAAIVGVCGDEDDDGNVASAPTIVQEAPKAKKPAYTPVSPESGAGANIGGLPPLPSLAAPARASRTEAAMSGSAPLPAVLRFEGVVEKVYENAKSTKIILESGESLVAWHTDVKGLEAIEPGGRYWFSCKASKNPTYPSPLVTDFGEAGLKGGEEIPF